MCIRDRFYFGATPDNSEELANLKSLEGCCGVKLFAGSSTGTLLVHKEEDIEKVFKHTSKVVAVHSEDEDILNQRKKLRVKGDVKATQFGGVRNAPCLQLEEL